MKALLIAILFCVPIAAQNAMPPSAAIQENARLVTVNLKEGAPVSGRFILADQTTIQIEVAGNVLKIKVDDVIGLIFAQELATMAPLAQDTSPQIAAANAALRALRKLVGATEIGINHREYGLRLIDAKNEVDEALSKLPNGELKNELSLAMDAYVDAGQAWGKMVASGSDFILHTYEPGNTLMRKYSMEPGIRHTLALPRNYVMNTIWSFARSHIERAASLLGSDQSTKSAPSPTPPHR